MTIVVFLTAYRTTSSSIHVEHRPSYLRSVSIVALPCMANVNNDAVRGEA